MRIALNPFDHGSPVTKFIKISLHVALGIGNAKECLRDVRTVALCVVIRASTLGDSSMRGIAAAAGATGCSVGCLEAT